MNKPTDQTLPSYNAYLKIPSLLELQEGLPATPCQRLPDPERPSVGPSDFLGNEERLFITVHQVFELWFKVAIGELEAFHRTLGAPGTNAKLPEDRVQWLVGRLRRVTEVFRQGISHFDLMETMSPIDFLAFRDKLTPASGFQSVQMRKMEVLLGYALHGRRILREGKGVKSFFHEDRDRMELDRIEQVVARHGDIKTSVMAWLRRTPIDFTGHPWRAANPDGIEPWDDSQKPIEERRSLAADAFLSAHYRGAVRHIQFTEERCAPGTLENVQRMNRRHLAARERYLSGLEPHHALEADIGHLPSEEPGDIREVIGLTGATLETRLEERQWRYNRQVRAALIFIQTYPSMPLLAWPHALIEELLAMEQHLLLWRNRHARMVELVIGRRPGTGGSAGVSYLDQTSQHRIFAEIWNSRTFLLDRKWVTRTLADGSESAYIRDASGFYSNLG